MPRRKSLIVFVCALFLGLMGSLAFAETDKMSPNDFATFVADHQNELYKLVDGFGTDWSGNFTWAVLGFFGKFLLLCLFVSFVLDVLIAKGFSMVIAPTLQSFQRAIMWAVSRFAVAFLYVVIVAGLLALLTATKSLILFGLLIILAIVFLFGVLAVATSMIYQMSLGVAMAVTLSATLLELLINYFALAPLQGTYLASGLQNLIRENVVAKIQVQTESLAPVLKQAQASLDDANQAVDSIRSSIDNNNKKAADYKIAIELKRKSDESTLVQIAGLRANGKLQEAADAYRQFPTQFPGSAFLDAAAADLQDVTDQMEQEAQAKAKLMAEQEAMKAQREKELILKMSQGNATLSDMRNRLLGMTREQVRAYLGTPDETASERWGYAKKIIVDREHNVHSGLTVVFSLNQVQSVDYYNYVPPASE